MCAYGCCYCPRRCISRLLLFKLPLFSVLLTTAADTQRINDIIVRVAGLAARLGGRHVYRFPSWIRCPIFVLEGTLEPFGFCRFLQRKSNNVNIYIYTYVHTYMLLFNLLRLERKGGGASDAKVLSQLGVAGGVDVLIGGLSAQVLLLTERWRAHRGAKKPKRRVSAGIDTSDLLASIPRNPGAHAELSTAELERKVDEWSKMDPEELEKLFQRLDKQEREESRVLEEDSLYQMDVSLRERSQGAVRVFWRDVDVGKLDDVREGWYTVLVDGRKVKAFESRGVLAIPSEAMAYACAREYAEQKDYLNKLLMPLTDLCSGALAVVPQMITPRIDYLMSFYQNDNMYFRSPLIAEEQDRNIDPVSQWFSREFGVNVPRVVGIGHPQIPPDATFKVRDALLAMSMNPYQVVALCVAAQFTSSLILPLAMFHEVVDLPTALNINRAEESHNTRVEGMIEGYHDIREADVVTKLCAATVAWKLMKDVSLSKSLEVPRTILVEGL
uniref:Uncharacterized protein TCIL3000_10_11830 n=1 Tax=Trypanosoma congolense (strain IL3000) TaxID=1068625 RepID=G0UYD5_TRYCI|nr:unnamed protein product [Trypanosoma congolense IL3000]